MKYKHYLLLTVVTAIMTGFMACGDDEPEAPAPSDGTENPSGPDTTPDDGDKNQGDDGKDDSPYGELGDGDLLATGSVSDITQTSATLHGTMNMDHMAWPGIFEMNFRELSVVYSVLEDGVDGEALGWVHYDKMTKEKAGVMPGADGHFSITVTDLMPGTKFYYRIHAVYGGEDYYSDQIRSFTTPAAKRDTRAGEAVDLGIGVKWADRNVGADSPADAGKLYLWGTVFSIDDYPDAGDYRSKSISWLRRFIQFDENDNLRPECDAATANWGGKWRMPTPDEIMRLMYYCDWEWQSEEESGGSPGVKVTGPNGNHIFLPQTKGHSSGYYPSNTLSTGYDQSVFHILYFDWNINKEKTNGLYLYHADWDYPTGRNIRPVYIE